MTPSFPNKQKTARRTVAELFEHSSTRFREDEANEPHAFWTILTPEAENSDGEMKVRTSDDAGALIMTLGKSGLAATLVQHQNRPTVYDEYLCDIPDHDVTVGIWQGFGYLSFADLEHEYMHSDGLPDSPSFAGHYTEYPAGSGVSLATLRTALVEFLKTAQRPTNIRWKEDR